PPRRCAGSSPTSSSSAPPASSAARPRPVRASSPSSWPSPSPPPRPPPGASPSPRPGPCCSAPRAAPRDRALPTSPVEVIVEPGVRLPDGLERLAATVAQVAPRLLILDPLIRLHRADENSAAEMAVLLGGLRGLGRATECPILRVHHPR